jgi:uncharacterized protein Yka (UPF0111/DUF47 family)
MRFLPREEKFFELFLDQVKLISEAAALLHDGVKVGNSRLTAASEKIAVLEGKADEIIHEIFQRLNQTFITPLDPEDIHSLSSRLDDVMDGLEDLAHRIVAYRIDPIPKPVIQGCGELVTCIASLERAFSALHSNQKVVEHCIEVNRVEEAVDILVRGAIKDLFEHEKDAIQLIKLKEVYDVLEATTDSCEDVAVALQNVVVKNS